MMAYDQVFSEDPPIIITEADDGFYHVYLEGELCGIAYSGHDAREVAQECYDAYWGDPLEELDDE